MRGACGPLRAQLWAASDAHRKSGTWLKRPLRVCPAADAREWLRIVRRTQAAPARTHATARPRAPRPLRAASVQAAPQTAVAAPGGAVDGKRVVALSSDEYEDFLAAHDCVLVDFCTE
jgi:hypothetical protein